MNDQMDSKHTAEIGHVLSGKVRVAIPLTLVLVLLLLVPLAAGIGIALSTWRPTASSVPTRAEGMELVPAVHHPSPRKPVRQPILVKTPETTTTSPCHNQPVLGETRSGAGPAE